MKRHKFCTCWTSGHCMFLIEPGSMSGAHAYMFDHCSDGQVSHGSVDGAANFQQLLNNHLARENMHKVVCKREFQKALCVATHKRFPKTKKQELRTTYHMLFNCTTTTTKRPSSPSSWTVEYHLSTILVVSIWNISTQTSHALCQRHRTYTDKLMVP